MIWMFLMVVTIALALVKLGALSVWVAVLSTALKLVVLTVTLLAAAWIARSLWRRVKAKRESKQATTERECYE